MIVKIKHRLFMSSVILFFILIIIFQEGIAYSTRVNTNPTGCITDPVLTSDQWQNISNQPIFSWSGATGTIEGYYVYFGTSSSGTDTAFTTDTSFQPPVGVTTGTYYLRINTKDTGEDIPDLDWATLFILKFDNSPPTISATEFGGAIEWCMAKFCHLPIFFD